MKVSKKKLKGKYEGKKSLFFMSNISSLAIQRHFHFKSLNRKVNKEITTQPTEVELQMVNKRKFQPL